MKQKKWILALCPSSSIIVLALLHVPLLIFDMCHLNDFAGDRSNARLARIHGFINSINDSNESVLQYLATNGLVGDYIFQAIPMVLGGKPLLIFVQIILFFISLVFLHKLALKVSGSNKISFITVVVYGLLPHSLAHPHLLITEAFFNPFIIISFYYLISYLKNPEHKPKNIIVSAIFLGLTAIIRPVTILYPLFVVIVMIFSREKVDKKKSVIYLLTSFAPLLLWTFFVVSSTGEWSLGAKKATLGYNLYHRVQRMKAGTNIENKESSIINSPPVLLSEQSISFIEYLTFVVHNPQYFLRVFKSDTVNLLFNSGVNKLFGYYLQVYDPKNSIGKNWRDIERKNLVETFKKLLSFQENSTYIIINIIFSIVWTLILLGCIAGFVIFWKDYSPPISIKLHLTVFPLYITCVTIFFVINFRSGHRSPFEFILCMMFAYFCVKGLENNKKTIYQ